MARCEEFREFATAVIARGTGEIGMHLHAWDTPPIMRLTADDNKYQPYLIDYPETVMREKIIFLTSILEETFRQKMVSHRAGRWSLDATYARLLVEQGYRVDCSVTPHVSWRAHRGDPARQGGSDFTNFPEMPYFMDLKEISRPGDSPLLEVPVTIRKLHSLASTLLHRTTARFRVLHHVATRLSPPVQWLRPNGRNRKALCALVESVKERPVHHLQFMLHSSEVMPGGNPTFRTERHIDQLFDDMESLFSLATTLCIPSTMAEYVGRCSHLSSGSRNGISDKVTR
jgi:hypothetical protein